MSLSSIIYEDTFMNILDISQKDVATIALLDQSELYRKPYIKSVKEDGILSLQKHYRFPIIKWCGFPKDSCYNFSTLATNLYIKGFMNENSFLYITNKKCVNYYQKIKWCGKTYFDEESKKQTRASNIGLKYDFDISCLIFTKQALYMLHQYDYRAILEGLIKSNTVIYTIKKHIDELYKYPKKFWVVEEQPSIMSAQIDGLILWDKLKYKISKEV